MSTMVRPANKYEYKILTVNLKVTNKVHELLQTLVECKTPGPCDLPAIGKGLQVGGRWRCHSVDHVPKVTCIPLECRVGGAKARLKLKQSLSFNFTLLFITL